jgi:DNA-binding CsgD family transcriptional regulator
MQDTLTKDELYYLNRIIADLYDENTPERVFQNFLEQLKELVFFEKGDIYFYRSKKTEVFIDEFISVDWGSDLDLYLGNYYAIDDVLPVVADKTPKMFRCSDIFETSERKKTRYYHELLAPAGMEYSIEGNLTINEGGEVSGIGIHRSASLEDFSEKDLSVLKLCRVHLARIADRYRQSRGADNEYLRIFPSIMRMKNVGIVFLDSDFSVMVSNLPDTDIVPSISEAAILQKIINVCREVRRKRDQQLAAGISAEFRIKSRIIEDGKSYFTNITCVPKPGVANEHRYAIMIFNYSEFFGDILGELKAVYRLTEREFEVLQAMMRGKNNQEIAAELFITLPTVKKHLSSIYQKLAVDGQRQILGLLLER